MMHHCRDYIRGLTASREAGWVASGGFDGLIKLWDINESRSSPIGEFQTTLSAFSDVVYIRGNSDLAPPPQWKYPCQSQLQFTLSPLLRPVLRSLSANQDVS